LKTILQELVRVDSFNIRNISSTNAEGNFYDMKDCNAKTSASSAASVEFLCIVMELRIRNFALKMVTFLFRTLTK
jgi:hypothetical protein